MNTKFTILAIIGVVILSAIGMYLLSPDELGPCRRIQAACEEGGFKLGVNANNRRQLLHACFRPIVRGKSVADIRVDPEDVDACRERQIKRRRKGKQNPAPNAPDDDSDDEVSLTTNKTFT